jgi:hypothetical protein
VADLEAAVNINCGVRVYADSWGLLLVQTPGWGQTSRSLRRAHRSCLAPRPPPRLSVGAASWSKVKTEIERRRGQMLRAGSCHDCGGRRLHIRCVLVWMKDKKTFRSFFSCGTGNVFLVN